jgi:hypothetical protein
VPQHRLTDRFWLVTTRWRMSFDKTPAASAQQIASETVFIADTCSEPFRIVMFLHNDDVVARPGKGRGLLE